MRALVSGMVVARGVGHRHALGRTQPLRDGGPGIRHPGCNVPAGGRDWIPTLPPVVLDRWPAANGIERDALTTVRNWRGYGSEPEGVHIGQKAHSLRDLMGLPQRTHERFLLALAIHLDKRADLEALATHRWKLADPGEVASAPAAYRRFVRGSKAEFDLTKSGYVGSRCGWFSDRSACYLASGGPVVAEDTGFSAFLPTGEGLLAFDDEDGAAAAVKELHGDYPSHARAARELAEEHLDARPLGQLST